ncbi:MAG: DEAD/DEAH box helicase family protein [Gemmatimonadaceae bacterium]
MSDPKAIREYNLVIAREDDRPRREPAAHQVEALNRLAVWYASKPKGGRGGILVLPTGGGKTFTAVRFLCTGPLSDGYKVLWLAHTHHLLEQAADAFGGMLENPSAPEAAWVREPKTALHVRLVSGTPGHSRVHEVSTADDVVICTLPSAARALREQHSALMAFLDAAGDKLVVVFDEAHHAPAPTYTRLITALRERHPSLVLLGLTATPAYSQEARRGWLKRLFPQGIIHRARVANLMANRILARPRFEQVQTRFTPDFTAREFAKWAATYQDLPEHIVSTLAEDRGRNDFIVNTYLNARAKYGRTIIFADRWYQCDYLREALLRHGVRADVVYSHVAADNGGADARNRRTADDNAQVLDKFRRGELDVLINVRMLTEGTDVPSVQTVFLTRQTTSPILLTQMIGRALRGTEFGGTEDAYVVSFVDEWAQPITFAEFDQLPDGEASDADAARPERTPVQLLSVELVRRLSRELHNPDSVAIAPYLSNLPIGWYRAEFDVRAQGTEDIEQVRRLVLVMDNEQDSYSAFVNFLSSAMPRAMCDVVAREDITPEEAALYVANWAAEFFTESEPSESRATALLDLARHVAQTGTRPQFFAFEERAQHDLDALARHNVSTGLGLLQIHQSLCAEFNRSDRFWRALYPTFDLFSRHHHSAQLRVITEAEHGRPLTKHNRQNALVIRPAAPREVPDDIKRAVLTRDEYRCLCCGSKQRRALQVDHVAPTYFGGRHDMDNLQTLCSTCNRTKGLNEFNFRMHATPLQEAPAYLLVALRPSLEPRDMDAWEQHIRRTLNFYYHCAAVQDVTIKRRGPDGGHWSATLYPDNNPRWLKQGLSQALRKQIEEARARAGLTGPKRLTVDKVSQRQRL